MGDVIRVINRPHLHCQHIHVVDNMLGERSAVEVLTADAAPIMRLVKDERCAVLDLGALVEHCTRISYNGAKKIRVPLSRVEPSKMHVVHLCDRSDMESEGR